MGQNPSISHRYSKKLPLIGLDTLLAKIWLEVTWISVMSEISLGMNLFPIQVNIYTRKMISAAKKLKKNTVWVGKLHLPSFSL